MSSIPEEDVQNTSSVRHQVFPEAIPSMTAQESKAKAAEDILAASADEEKEEDREVIPPTVEPVVQKEVIVPNPLVVPSTEAPASDDVHVTTPVIEIPQNTSEDMEKTTPSP